METPVLFILEEMPEVGIAVTAQDLKTKDVPTVAQTALSQKYPQATKVSWEKEKSNYEANWGGRSGEDHSVQFTPAGQFVEQVDAIAVKDLSAKGALTFEVELKGKDTLFSTEGIFISGEHE